MTNQHKDLITQITKKIRAINDKIALVKTTNGNNDNAVVILDRSAYGEDLPTTGVDGQLFFHIVKEEPKEETEE